MSPDADAGSNPPFGRGADRGVRPVASLASAGVVWTRNERPGAELKSVLKEVLSSECRAGTLEAISRVCDLRNNSQPG